MTGTGLAVRGAELIDDLVVWPGSDPRRRDLALHERAWRFVGPAPLRIQPNERFIYATRLHWTLLVKDMTKMGAVPIAGFFIGQLLDFIAPYIWFLAPHLLLLTMLVWLSVLLHTCLMCHHVLGWRAQIIVVTSRRIRIVKGVFSNHVENINLALYTNLSVDQTYLQRLMNYGTVRLESGGQHTDGSEREYISHVPTPEDLEDAIMASGALRPVVGWSV
jgi:hypothetical protein